jgi:exopolysaccharide biosynthesis protein
MMSLTGLLLAAGLLWHPARPGMAWSESHLAKEGPLSNVDVIVVRMDPRKLQFQLDTATLDYGIRAAWTIDRMPENGVAAFNAGQFIGGIPWGWLVIDGVEQREPGTGRLSMSFVIDSDGTATLTTPDELPAVRRRARFAFQSYPMLLSGNGEVPWELRAAGRGVNLTHRDSRLALGVLPDGSVVVALTRFTGAGPVAGSLPWGPTVPEMAELMRSLGCDRAMLLDGGISSQLAIRSADGTLKRWANWRPVPLAVIATPRALVSRLGRAREIRTAAQVPR